MPQCIAGLSTKNMRAALLNLGGRRPALALTKGLNKKGECIRKSFSALGFINGR